MAAIFKLGQTVRQVQPAPAQGEVKLITVDADGELQYLISWIDAAGNIQERYFIENQIQAV